MSRIDLKCSVKANSRVTERRKYHSMVAAQMEPKSRLRDLLGPTWWQGLDTSFILRRSVCRRNRVIERLSCFLIRPSEYIYLKNFYFSWKSMRVLAKKKLQVLLSSVCVLSGSVTSDSFDPMDCSPPGSSVSGIIQLENCISFILITELPTTFCTSVSYYSRLNDNVPYSGIEKQVYKYAYIFSRGIL